MTAGGAEQNQGGISELDTRRAEAARLTATQLLKQLQDTDTKAKEVKSRIDSEIRNTEKAPDSFTGDPNDKESAKGKATDIKQVVQRVLLGAQSPEKKIPTPAGKPPDVITLSSKIIDRLSAQVRADEVSDTSAPYLHHLITRAANGELTNIDEMARELAELRLLAIASPGLYTKVQTTLAETAKDQLSLPEEEVNRKLGIRERAMTQQEQPTGNMAFDRMWQEHYSSYFDAEDKPFVASLYSPTEFVQFTENLKGEIALKIGKPQDSEAVAMETSKELERKMVGLYGKLYTRLDHDRPSEFFHEIEQQDIMRGILPVKQELKRRMTLLATELDRSIDEGKIQDPKLYQSVEMRADIMDVPKDDGKKVKPRVRLNPFTQPRKTDSHHPGQFIFYLDQIAEHYVEARKYTHNARAIFLHPVDPEKGFYSQLAQFANDMTTVDFDQLMSLPGNELFQDAFSLYDKILEETFASNDWRHSPTMFSPKQNQHYNQIEEDVFDKLKQMYHGRKDITESQLEAALSMAVGASRGMFLNEIEKAAYADPHLTEDGGATFASYYNQDVSALLAFNPMHQFFRWQAPNTLDPILFTPVESLKGSGAFGDHRELWKKMQAYKDSFVAGRAKGGIEGETLFTDFVVNIGKVGGPLQRKGWRTSYMLEPLIMYDRESDPKKVNVDYIKTWKRFENIGYEVLQDWVGKLAPTFTQPGHAAFLGAYGGKGGLHESAENKRFVGQKKEMFGYIYEKYFKKDASGLDGYLNKIRRQAQDKIYAQVKSGHLAPNDLQERVEIETSNIFLNRALARVVAQRIPSKLLRMDRDRFTADGVGKWRKIANVMGADGGRMSTAEFDDVMKDLLLAERMLRKDVSAEMRKGLGNNREPWELGDIPYELTEAKLRHYLSDKVKPERMEQTVKLLKLIETNYTKNDEYLDGKGGLGEYIQKGEYKFSFALDEVDMSFIPWRGAGQRVLPRAVGDISGLEKNLSAEVIKLPKLLQQIAIDGKHDYTPVIELMTKVYGSLDGVIGTDYAHKVVHHIAALTIKYFRKDDRARALYGLFGMGRKNSLAAERAGRSTAVWEWDSLDVDRFCIALETRGLLPKEPYSTANSKPEYQPLYIQPPFATKPIKLPESINMLGLKIPLFRYRKPDFEWTSRDLRMKFGGSAADITFDVLNRYLPLIMVWLLWKYMQDAMKESEGKKK